MANKVCRFCFGEEQVFDIFQTNLDNIKKLIDKIEATLGIYIREDDFVSRRICCSCFNQLLQSYNDNVKSMEILQDESEKRIFLSVQNDGTNYMSEEIDITNHVSENDENLVNAPKQEELDCGILILNRDNVISIKTESFSEIEYENTFSYAANYDTHCSQNPYSDLVLPDISESDPETVVQPDSLHSKKNETSESDFKEGMCYFLYNSSQHNLDKNINIFLQNKSVRHARLDNLIKKLVSRIARYTDANMFSPSRSKGRPKKFSHCVITNKKAEIVGNAIRKHESVQKLFKKYKNIVIPTELYCTDIAPTVSLNKNVLNDWYVAKIDSLLKNLKSLSNIFEYPINNRIKYSLRKRTFNKTFEREKVDTDYAQSDYESDYDPGSAHVWREYQNQMK